MRDSLFTCVALPVLCGGAKYLSCPLSCYFEKYKGLRATERTCFVFWRRDV
nr:MAG TPA: hypothetical protein [Caudoviricetes sp.]